MTVAGEGPMDLEKRIERAAKVMQDIINSSTREPWTVHVPALRLVLEAFAPELFSSPPTGWIAPVELDEALKDAAADAVSLCYSLEPGEGFDEPPGPAAYEAIRDAYLSRQVKP